MRLALVPTGAFTRGLKRMTRRHVSLEPFEEVLDLIAENSEASLQALKAHHRMHSCKVMQQLYMSGYVGNAGDLLLVWPREGDTTYMLRLGSHNQVVLGRRGRY